MTEFVKADFAPLSGPKGATYVVFVGADLKLASRVAGAAPAAQGLIASAAKAARFSGKPLSALDILSPHGVDSTRLLVIGLGAAKEA